MSLASLAVAAPVADAITLQDPVNFRVARTFTVSPGVPRPIGGLRFSADGATLYVVGGADTNTSALYRMAVTRHATTREVTALGTPAKVFDGVNPDPTEGDAGLDAGLEFGPAGTFFYSYFPSSVLGQRPGGVAGTERTTTIPGPVSLSGLTFSPLRTDPGTGFGYLDVSTGVTGFIYEIPLVPGTITGTFVKNPVASIRLLARAYRSGPPRVGGQGVAGLQYVPAGTFARDLLYASFVDRELWSIRIDETTGLPIGGGNAPVEDLVATGFVAPPIGLEFDPITSNELFVSTYDAATNAGNQILQIAGFASTAPTTTTAAPSTTSTSSTTTTSSSSTTTTSSSTSSSTTTSRPPMTTATTSSTSTSRPPTTSTSTSTTTSRPSTSSTTTSRPPTTSTTTSRPSSTTTSTTRPSTTSTSTSTSTTTSRPATTSTSSSTTTSTSRPATSTTLPATVTIRTSSLTLRDASAPVATPSRRRLTFQARTGSDPAEHQVVVPPAGGAGDPTTGGAVLEVYNAAGSGERVAVTLPAAGWVAHGDPLRPSGYRWSALSRTDPVSRVVVRADRIRVRAAGATWGYTLDEPAQGAIALTLRLGAAPTWCASAAAKTSGTPPSSSSYDRVDRFVGERNAPPPPSCPPAP